MIDIPSTFEERMRRMEEKADKMMPGDYTLRANFFTDDEGRDLHIVAVHNFKVNNNEIEYRLHEGNDNIRVEWVNKVETRQNDTE